MANGKTPQSVAAKWRKNFAGAAESYKAGVMAVTQSPTQAAARAQDRMVSNLQDSVSSGRYAKACNSVSTSDWQNAVINKGVGRLASGAQAGESKMDQFMGEWLPIMDAVSAKVQSMPKGTTEDALARVRVAIEAGKRYAGKSV